MKIQGDQLSNFQLQFSIVPLNCKLKNKPLFPYAVQSSNREVADTTPEAESMRQVYYTSKFNKGFIKRWAMEEDVIENTKSTLPSHYVSKNSSHLKFLEKKKSS